MSIKIYVKYVKNNRDFHTTKLNLPTGNLDGINKRIVLDILRKEHEKGRAIVVITHDDETANAADKKYILENGKLL
mgnify:CR=1 FL=1